MVDFANFHLKFEQEPRSLADVVASAQRTALAGSGWLFLVPLESRRGFNISTNDTFLTPKDFETEFTAQFPGIDVPENRGGLRLVEDQIDKYAAIEGARRQLTGLLERLGASGTTRRRLRLSSTAWVNPGGWTVDLGHVSAARFRFSQLDADGGAALFQPSQRGV